MEEADYLQVLYEDFTPVKIADSINQDCEKIINLSNIQSDIMVPPLYVTSSGTDLHCDKLLNNLKIKKKEFSKQVTSIDLLTANSEGSVNNYIDDGKLILLAGPKEVNVREERIQITGTSKAFIISNNNLKDQTNTICVNDMTSSDPSYQECDVNLIACSSSLKCYKSDLPVLETISDTSNTFSNLITTQQLVNYTDDFINDENINIEKHVNYFPRKSLSAELAGPSPSLKILPKPNGHTLSLVKSISCNEAPLTTQATFEEKNGFDKIYNSNAKLLTTLAHDNQTTNQIKCLKLKEARSKSRKHKNSQLVKIDSSRNENYKYEMRWRCLICSIELSTHSNLNKHYILHKKEDLCSTLSKLTKHYYTRLATKNSYPYTNLQENSYNREVRTSDPKSLIQDKCDLAEEKLPDTVSKDKKDLHEVKVEVVEVSDKVLVRKVKPKSTTRRVKQNSKSMGPKSREPHQCTICKKMLCSRGNLAKHLILHQAVKPWMCDTCSIGFNAKRDYDQHYKQIHTNIRPYVCKICGNGYTQSRSLNEHMVFHNSKKAFKCEICEKSFLTIKCLKRHMPRHNPEKKYLCYLCCRPFRVQVDLISHLKSVHKDKRNFSRAKHKYSTVCKIDDRIQNSHNLHSTGTDADLQSKPVRDFEIEGSVQPEQVVLLDSAITNIKDVAELLLPAETSVMLADMCEITGGAAAISSDHFYATDSGLVSPLIPVSTNAIETSNSKLYFDSIKNKVRSSSEASFVMIGLPLEDSQMLTTSQTLSNSTNMALFYEHNKDDEHSPLNSNDSHTKFLQDKNLKLMSSESKNHLEVGNLTSDVSTIILHEKLEVPRHTVSDDSQDLSLELISQTLNLEFQSHNGENNSSSIF